MTKQVLYYLHTKNILENVLLQFLKTSFNRDSVYIYVHFKLSFSVLVWLLSLQLLSVCSYSYILFDKEFCRFGIPQESVLGALLLVLYINEILAVVMVMDAVARMLLSRKQRQIVK